MWAAVSMTALKVHGDILSLEESTHFLISSVVNKDYLIPIQADLCRTPFLTMRYD